MFRILATATVLAALAATAEADVYRVVDAQGHVQYTDRWVPGSERVKVDKNHPTPDAIAARHASEQSKLAASNTAIASKQADQKTAQAVQEDVAKTREEQCKQAKERYDKAILARRIFRTDKDGNKEYISDAEADAYRLQARQDRDGACGPQTK